MTDRRLPLLVLVLVALAVPAAALRLTCVGRTCDAIAGRGGEPAPFCGLPVQIRELVGAGFREGRSPDVLGVVAEGGAVDGGTRAWTQSVAVTWPELGADPSVPLVFSGVGVAAGATIAPGATLAQVAPTIASVIRFDRPFPDVRSGTELDGVADGHRPRLVLQIALKGVGGREVADLRGWPHLDELMSGGAGTTAASTGALPLDPAASLATIGTGGPPSEHGITGTVLRNTEGAVTRAWGEGAPGSVIATLPEDLDEATDQRALVGLVATDPADAGIVGGAWYPRHDRDPAVVAPSSARAVLEARRLLATGFGEDRMPDVLAVVIEGSPEELDDAVGELRDAAFAATRSALIVVAGTGSASDPAPGTTIGADELVGALADVDPQAAGLVEVAVPGGMFVDRARMTREGLTGQVVRDALLELRTPADAPLMADSFQSFAVSFGRYC